MPQRSRKHRGGRDGAGRGSECLGPFLRSAGGGRREHRRVCGGAGGSFNSRFGGSSPQTETAGRPRALLTGLDHALGDVIATMDGDLQHDPAHLPEMIDLLRGGRRRVPRQTAQGASPTQAFEFRNRQRHPRPSIPRRSRGYRVHLPRSKPPGAGWTPPGSGACTGFFPRCSNSTGTLVIQPVIPQRPRLRGRSKYGVWNRLPPGIADLFGMLWYSRRFLPPRRMENAVESRVDDWSHPPSVGASQPPADGPLVVIEHIAESRLIAPVPRARSGSGSCRRRRRAGTETQKHWRGTQPNLRARRERRRTWDFGCNGRHPR